MTRQHNRSVGGKLVVRAEGLTNLLRILENSGSSEAKAVADLLKNATASRDYASPEYLKVCLRQLIHWSEVAICEIEKQELIGRRSIEGELAPDSAKTEVAVMSVVDDLPEFLTVDEYAAILRRGRSSAYEDVRCDRVRALRMGRRVLIPRSEVQRLMQDL